MEAKKQLPAVQQQCIVCCKQIKPEHDCKGCGAASYCSAECKTADSKHNIVCISYARIPPPPSKDHRICLLFTTGEIPPRFLWVPCSSASDRSRFLQELIAPHNEETEFSEGLRINGEDDVTYRSVAYWTTINTSSLSNKKLEGVVGIPMQSIRGHFVAFAQDHVGSYAAARDLNPADFSRLLIHLKQQEEKFASAAAEDGEGFYDDAGAAYDGDEDSDDDFEYDYDGYDDLKEQFRGRNWTAPSGSTRL